VGTIFSQMISVLVVASVLASQLAIAAVTSRYVYSLGRDRVFPQQLGTVHERHGSPHRAAVASITVVIAAFLVVTAAGVDPVVAYGTFAGVMMFGFELIVLLVSVAVIVYFRRNRGTGESLWSTVIAPVLTIVAFGWLLYFTAAKADLLLGVWTPLTPILFALLAFAVVAGVGYASWAAVRKPDVYARIGRAEG
jgi:amino acid transporter